jgi:NADH-ubiquinone oxidoreductase chain 5
MYLLLILLSFIGSCFSGFFGKYLGFYVTYLTIICIFFSFIFSILAFYEVIFLNSQVYLILINWINSDIFHVTWGFVFDTTSILMCIVVFFISFLVHIYSIEYMSHDPHICRFMCYLSLFTFFMIILISADNFLQMFVGWEGVGLCSYLLINFWFTRIQANKAAIKAMILNRIGDFSLILAILIIFVNFKSLNFSTIAVLAPFFKYQNFNLFFFDFNLINIICLFLFVGAMGKSAQVGLHTWLPDAMEGPTPVSALIHAATMVTAGVFLIVRASFIFELSFKFLEFLIIIGTITAFMASSIGLVQNDLKKVIAYSTCSQLGYMIFACGLSNYYVGLFHLTNHAFFKALLFLSAGSIIHSINDEQDLRKMGGLKYFLPFTYFMVISGSLALTGFPFLTGFYSKDFILETAFSKHTFFSYFSYYIGTLGAFFTSFYSMRLLLLTFLLKPNGYKKILCYATDSGYVIKFVLTILALPSIFVGYLSKDLIIGFGTPFFETAIFYNLKTSNVYDAEFLPIFVKTLPVHFSLLGFFLAFLFYKYYLKILIKFKLNSYIKKIYVFFSKKWYFDKIYNELIASFFFNFGYSISYKFIDRGLFELLGPTGLSFLTLNLSYFIDRVQLNTLYHLTLTIFIMTSLCFFFEIFNFFIIFNEYILNKFIEHHLSFNYIFSIDVEFFNLNIIFINLFILTCIFTNFNK